MKKNKVFAGLLFAVVLIAFIIVGYSSKSNILGKWENNDGEDAYRNPAYTYEFLEDGTVLSDNRGYTYSLLDGGKLKIDEGFGDVFVCTYKVRGNTLTLQMKHEDGSVLKSTFSRKD